MKKFLARTFVFLVVSATALSTIVVVVLARGLAWLGTKLVDACAARLGVETPWLAAARSKQLDTEPIEALLRSAIPSKAQRAAACAALDAYKA